MTHELVRFGITFVLALVSAGVFLALRCHREGRPFGPSSRWWALAAMLLTGATSTAAAYASVALMQVVPPFVVSIAVPSGLWLSTLERQPPEQHAGRLPEVPLLGLGLLLERLHQAIADDRLTWCESRVDQMWRWDQLLDAALYYKEAIKDRLPTSERTRARLDARLKAIEDRLEVVRLIHDNAKADDVHAAMRKGRVTREKRYERYRDDLMRLASLLRHDSERELVRMLDIAYRYRFYRLKPYTGASAHAPATDGSAADIRPHP